MQASSSLPLENKVALVTGASRRNGRAIALKLAGMGADLAVHAHTARDEVSQVAEEIRNMGRKSAAFLGDIAQEADVLKMFEAINSEFGGVDILINNAGVRHEKPFTELTMEEWRNTMAITVDGSFLCAREAIRSMLTRGGGRVVNVGGLSAHIGAKQRAHVSTGKAAVIGLTRALAVEFGHAGITANCVVPGRIGGERSATAGKLPELPDGSGSLVGRMGEFEDVAHIVASICHPSAGYITGQAIHVSGGLYMN